MGPSNHSQILPRQGHSRLLAPAASSRRRATRKPCVRPPCSIADGPIPPAMPLPSSRRPQGATARSHATSPGQRLRPVARGPPGLGPAPRVSRAQPPRPP
eukprot:8944700-Alexandrium_andersonii.AAC.1